MNKIKNILTVLTFTILLAIPSTTALAANCPPHSYFHDGTFQAPQPGGSHTVTVPELDPVFGGYKYVTKTCIITEIRNVYEYRCRNFCGAYFTNDYLAYETHSISHN